MWWGTARRSERRPELEAISPHLRTAKTAATVIAVRLRACTPDSALPL